MKLKLDTLLENKYLGVEEFTNPDPILSFKIKFYKKNSMEELIIKLNYNCCTGEVTHYVEKKGEAWISNGVWCTINPDSVDELFEDEYSDNAYITIREVTEFEKKVIEEVKKIVKEKRYKIEGLPEKYKKLPKKIFMEELKEKYNAWLISEMINREDAGIPYSVFLIFTKNTVLSFEYDYNYDSYFDLDVRNIDVTEEKSLWYYKNRLLKICDNLDNERDYERKEKLKKIIKAI